MTDKTSILFFLIIYIVIASAFVSLVDNTQNNVLSDLSGNYVSSVDLTESDFDNLDYSLTKNDCEIEFSTSGLHIINVTSENAYASFNFNTYTGDSEGSYDYHIVKDTNDRILLSFYDSSLSSTDHYFFIQNDNAYYGQANIYFAEKVYSNVGNDFTVKTEYSEDLNVWKYYINDEIVYIYEIGLFPLLETLSNVKNEITLTETTTYIQDLDFTESQVDSSSSFLGNIESFITTMAALIFWNIESIPWVINLIFIKTADVMLIYIFIMSIKGE